MAARRQQHARRSGRTLVDLLAWVSITGVLLAVSIPNVRRATKRMALSTSAQQLASAVAVARTRAQASSAPVTVLRVGTTGYKVAGGSTIPLEAGVTFAAGSADSVVFGSFGPPLAAATFTLLAAPDTTRVLVGAGGMLSVK
jgi:Tfp pilus assembly protein FimT